MAVLALGESLRILVRSIRPADDETVEDAAIC